MRKEGIQIGRIYGIPIFLHTSWFLIFGLIAFSFYSDFDALQLNLPTSRLVGLGIMTSLLFCGSLVFHEVAHSVVAKYYKIPVASITLFVFGGVSRITRDPVARLTKNSTSPSPDRFPVWFSPEASDLVYTTGGLKPGFAHPDGIACLDQFHSGSVQHDSGFSAGWRAHFPGDRLGHSRRILHERRALQHGADRSWRSLYDRGGRP